MRWIMAFLALALPAGAAERTGPGAGFFEGLYELVGRGPEGGLWQEPIRLKARGERFEVEVCADPDADEGLLAWERQHEAWRLVGCIRGVELGCTWAMTGGNTPVLICMNRDGARLMGWPEAAFGGPLICD